MWSDVHEWASNSAVVHKYKKTAAGTAPDAYIENFEISYLVAGAGHDPATSGL